jgi:mono/diheme cytochrome c family protein
LCEKNWQAAVYPGHDDSNGPVPAALDTARQAELLHLLKHDCGSCHGMTRKGGLGPP